MISYARAEQRPVADLGPADTLRVRLVARLVAGHGGNADGDVVGRAVAGGLQGQARVAAGDAALGAGAEVAVAADEGAGGGRVDADQGHVGLGRAV